MSMNYRRALPAGFEEVTQDEVAPKLRKAIRRAMKDKRWPIWLHGGAGTGKSCAMAWGYSRWMGLATWYRTEVFCRDIQCCRKNGSVLGYHDGRSRDVFESTIWRLADEPGRLYCIDDFGTRGSSDPVYEILLTLIDRRKGKPTIVTSNGGPAQLADVYDERIVSRLLAGTVIEVTGPDRRIDQGIRLRA